MDGEWEFTRRGLKPEGALYAETGSLSPRELREETRSVGQSWQGQGCSLRHWCVPQEQLGAMRDVGAGRTTAFHW